MALLKDRYLIIAVLTLILLPATDNKDVSAAGIALKENPRNRPRYKNQEPATSKGHIDVLVYNNKRPSQTAVKLPRQSHHPLVEHMYGKEQRIPIYPSGVTMRHRRHHQHHRQSPNYYTVVNQKHKPYVLNYVAKDYGKGKLPMPCVTCPNDQIIYVDQRKGCAKVVLPSLRYCTSLTRLPGRVHLAVTVGPKIGSKVKLGNYLMRLHILKGGLTIKTCDFRLHVQEAPCTSSQVRAPKHGIGECTNGTENSSCTFTCFPGYVLTGSSKIYCENGKWYGKRPKCQEIKEKPVERPVCFPPKDPDNGAFSCDGATMFYPGTICRIFCDEGYDVLETSVIMCTGTKWNNTQKIQCRSIQCSAPPIVGEQGRWKCINEKTKEASRRGDTIPNGTNYSKGTVCHYHCEAGYTVPTSLMNAATIECQAPHWNLSDSPKCYKQTPPSMYCQNEEILTEDGYGLLTLPKVLSSTGETLHPNCKYSGQLQAGAYINTCEATDPFLRSTANCSYNITVKTPECNALKETENGHIKCISPTRTGFPVGTLCQYFCNAGFIIPTSYFLHGVQKCLATLRWNSTITPSCRPIIKPKAENGTCKDIELSFNGTEPVQIPLPKFYTSNGSEVEVRCIITQVSREGHYENKCKAFDPELRTEERCFYVVNVFFNTGAFNGQKCDSLSAPENGHIGCATHTSKVECQVECRDGYMFPPSLTVLHSGVISCDRKVGQWDFQEKHGIKDIPNCLRELPTTSLLVPLRLNASVSDCVNVENLNFAMKSIRDGLVARMKKTCEMIKCLDFSHKCIEDKNSTILQTTWKLQVSFDPEDYELIDDIPEAETLLEAALLEAQKVFSSDSTFVKDVNETGAQLQSFQRGLFTLVCQESGFSADPLTYKCYECPSGMYENDGQCSSCPTDHFQKLTGQTKCQPCPLGSSSNPSATDCIRDGREARKCPRTHEKWFCKNGGTCRLKGENMECECAFGFEGERCEFKKAR